MNSKESFTLFFVLLISLVISCNLQAKSREDLPSPLPITSQDIRFDLVPNEPGPQWNCVHVEVSHLPNDWRVKCRSLTSSAELNFYVHFLVRIHGGANQFLEILYWVDEQMLINGKIASLSHGQSTLLTTGQTVSQIAFNLGQLVQNGTSNLNIYLGVQKRRK